MLTTVRPPINRESDWLNHRIDYGADVRFSRMTRMLALSVGLMRNSLDAMVTMPGAGLFAQRINAPSGIGECGEREGRRGG
jgi:hypothetical protein